MMMLGKTEGTRRGTAEDEIVGRKTPRDGEGQRSLACCCPWGLQELNMTEQLKNNNNLSNTHREENSGDAVLLLELAH